MNIRKIKIGVRDDIVDRADPSLLSKTGNGWSNVEYTIDQLISHIKKGHHNVTFNSFNISVKIVQIEPYWR
jgi:hypothetical protein